MTVVLSVALLAVSTFAAPQAKAQSTFDDDRVDFGGTNGQVTTVRAVGDQVWVGGTFTQAVDPDLTTSYPRANLAVFDFNTGEVLPIVADTNAKLKAIESDDATTVWVAGDFTQIAGQAVTYIAAFDAFTGERDLDFVMNANGEIKALQYHDGWLYVGGEFTQVNGLAYNRMVRVDPATGALDTNFRPNPDAPVRAIDAYGDMVYASGMFEEVGNAPDLYTRVWVVGLHVDTGQPSGPEFPLLPLQPGEASHRGGVGNVHVSPDGSYLYTGDNRNVLTQWVRQTGEIRFQQGARGDIQAIETDNDLVFFGTHEGFLVSGDDRLLVALDEATGASIDTFLPLQNSYFGTFGLTVSQGALIAVGDFTTVKGQASPHVAVFHGPEWDGAAPLTPVVLGDVDCDEVSDLGDALLVAQYSVGLRTISPTCPLADPLTQIGPGGDVDGDGSIDVGDALLIAQCTVGLVNAFCP